MVSHSRHIHKILAPIVANDNRIQTVGTWCKPSNYELLSEIEAMFDPCATPFPGLVRTISSLANHTLQMLIPSDAQHIFCARSEALGNTDAARLELQCRMHHLAALCQRQRGEVAILENENVKHKVVNPPSLGPEVLEQIEIGPARIV